MRLNDRRIEGISVAMVDRLAGDELVDLTLSEEDLSNMIASLIEADLAMEDTIQEEAVNWVRQNRKKFQEGSSQWDIELDKQRSQLAIRRGYILP